MPKFKEGQVLHQWNVIGGKGLGPSLLGLACLVKPNDYANTVKKKNAKGPKF